LRARTYGSPLHARQLARAYARGTIRV